MNIKESLKASVGNLKANEPYKTSKEAKAKTALAFSLPPSEIKTISDETNPRSKQTGFDVWQFVPKGREVELVEKDGNFHIPHKIYEFVHKVIETKMEILVFDCLLRYSLGFHRPTVKASQSFMSKWTGIAPPNIRKALKSLLEQGFIKLVSEGTAEHNSALYELPIVKAYLEYEKTISDKNDLRTEINSISNKEIINKNRNKTLPQEISEYVRNYFSSQMANAKRESEFKDFLEISKQYPAQDVSDCLKLVVEKGILKTGEHCHSPFRYLLKAMQDVLAEVQKQRRIQQSKIIERQLEIENRRQQEAQEAADTELEKAAIVAFERAFNTVEEQNAFVQSEVRKKYPMGTSIAMARNWVIVEWFQSQQQGEVYADQGIR
ncbi:MAG: hypothetical protein AB7F43_01805 [Bacteriovoracia bacterium]